MPPPLSQEKIDALQKAAKEGHSRQWIRKNLHFNWTTMQKYWPQDVPVKPRNSNFKFGPKTPPLLKKTDTNIKIKDPKDESTHGTLPVDLVRAKVCVALAYLKLNVNVCENALRHLLLACDKCDEYVK